MEIERAIRFGSTQVTLLLLVSAGLLLALGVAGVGGSLALVAVLAALAVVLYRTRPDESDVGYVLGVDVDGLFASLWLAPAVAAVPVLLELGATPDEVQALGGIVGLVGMANYFLRPLYLIGYGLVRSATDGSEHETAR